MADPALAEPARCGACRSTGDHPSLASCWFHRVLALEIAEAGRAAKDRSPPAPSQPERRIASLIVMAQAAPKRPTNKKLPCDNAKPQAPPASRESPISSRIPASMGDGFISRLF